VYIDSTVKLSRAPLIFCVVYKCETCFRKWNFCENNFKN